MKLYVADYLADTTHLTTREHGAYLLLLMAMWRAGGKLPANDVKLAKIVGMTAREWADVRLSILAFFRRRGAQLSHKRVISELAKYDTVSCNRKQGLKRSKTEKVNKSNEKSPKKEGDKIARSGHNQNQIEGEEGSKKPSSFYPRDRDEARHDGASSGPAEVVDLDALRAKIASGAFD